MLWYIARHFTANLTGRRLKTLTCEQCAKEFHYELSRTCTGGASAPYYLFQGAAKRRAGRQAQRRLARLLDRDSELVPCPNCKWINCGLIETYRRGKYRAWGTAGVAFLMLVASECLAFYVINSVIHRRPASFIETPLLLAISATVLLSMCCFLIQFLLRRGIDPNRCTDGLRHLPPGTPPALLKQQGSAAFVAVPSESSNTQGDVTWATFRAGQLAFEPYCCQCLDAATTRFKWPLSMNQKICPVPLCQQCLQKLRRRWWLQNLVILGFSLVIGGIFAALPREIDIAGRTVMTFLYGGIITYLGAIYTDQQLRPYRLGVIDNSRGVFKIYFKNPAYTAILIRKMGRRDGLFNS